MSVPALSVIICSFNPRPAYLTRVLSALQAQTLELNLWELLLVDNASSTQLSCSWDLAWHPHHRHIREEVLGLTVARVRGIREARGDLLVFVDDDNVVAPDYLKEALALARGYPHVKVFGAGELDPEFAIDPPTQLDPALPLLALRHEPVPLWTNNIHDTSCIAWGAGICVTREIAAAYVRLVERLTIVPIIDRRGTDLNCGGDDLFSWVAAAEGVGFGVFPMLRVRHLISAERLRVEYLLRLFHDHRYSHVVLRFVLFGEVPRGLGLRRIVRIAIHGTRHGYFSMRCAWAAALGARDAVAYLRRKRVDTLQPPLVQPVCQQLSSHWLEHR